MNLSIPRILLLLAAAAGLASCSSSSVDLPSLEVSEEDTEFSVVAKGEIITSEALPITLPSDVRMEFNIVWLAPEFSEVKKARSLRVSTTHKCCSTGNPPR